MNNTPVVFEGKWPTFQDILGGLCYVSLKLFGCMYRHENSICLHLLFLLHSSLHCRRPHFRHSPNSSSIGVMLCPHCKQPSVMLSMSIAITFASVITLGKVVYVVASSISALPMLTSSVSVILESCFAV